jgi:GMP synthase-like glutamine amidotransferase
MAPVVVIRTARSEGPAYFASYLERRSIAFDLVAIDEGAAVPGDPRHFSGIAIMGGAMSVNDDLPWIPQVLELVREAVRKDVPVLGHCLGGQLISKALGGTVGAAPVKEIGWGEVRVADNEVAREWLGEVQTFLSFHWHGESFSIPPGATRVMENPHCANQGFALGKHFGMQCHVEMTEELVRSWLGSSGEEIAASRTSTAVQEPEEITRELAPRLAALHEVANRIYDRWIKGLSRGS